MLRGAPISVAPKIGLLFADADIHAQWHRDHHSDELDRFYDEAFARIVTALGDTKGKHLLDVGCGYCFHTIRLARSDIQITGADFSQVALDHASSAIHKAKLQNRIRLRQADATNLPFENESFDHVLMWGVLMHIPQAENALSEAARVLKYGGKLVLGENNANSLEVRLLEPTINFLRRLFGKRDRKRIRSPLGIEEWQSVKAGKLLIRKTDIKAMVALLERKCLRLESRHAGQFTELYTRVPTRFLKKAIHNFNVFWFLRVRLPQLAVGNILIFEKVAKTNPSGV